MLLSWARKRQLMYGGGAALVLLLVFGAPFLARIFRGPSCADGRQNGGETGIDCGGACPRLCAGEAAEPRIVWQRVFNEGGGVASALLYGENLNRDAGALDARYYVKVYDSRGVLVAEKEAAAAVAPGGAFAVFAPNLFIGTRTVTRAVFERRGATEWRRDVPPLTSVHLRALQLSLTPLPRVEATALNTTDRSLDAVLTAILYDRNGTAVGASQTAAELAPRVRTPLVFSWRAPMVPAPVRAEILFGARAMR